MPSSSWSLLDCPAPAGRIARFKRWLGVRVIRLPRQRVVIVASTPGQLRELLARPSSAAPVRGVRIHVHWQALRPGWSGAVDPLPRLRRHKVSLPLRRRGLASVTFALHEPLPLRDVVRSALNALVPVRRLPMPASPDVAATGGVLPAFLPPAARVGPLPPPDEIRPTDVLLTGDPAADPALAGAVLVSDRSQAGGVVLLDAIRINPCGRPDRTAAGALTLVLGEPRSGPTVRSGPLDGIGLDHLTIEIVRRQATVDATGLAGWSGDPTAAAALLVQIAATGAVLRAPDLPPAVTKLLAPELAALLDEPTTADPVALEAQSIRQRRAALRGHAAELVLPRLAAFPQLRALPTVSALLMTRRPDILLPVLDALEKQSYPELEIVVGVHGCPPPPALSAWVARCARPVQVVEVPAGVDFGTGLGVVTARSHGSLVTKVDDDDTYGPEHVWDLVLARHYSGATMVGKGAEFVHLEERGETIRRRFGHPESYAESVAGGTILIGRGDLENAGGWRPVPRSVDLGVITRVRADGGLIYRTHPFGYVYHRRERGHTWDPGQQYFVDQAVTSWPGLPPYAEFGHLAAAGAAQADQDR